MAESSGGRPLSGVDELHAVLTLVLDLIDPVAAGFEYRLVGTAASLAQGVQLPVGDIDILVARRSDVDRFATALTGFPCLQPPAWLPQAQQYFGHFAVNGIDVGASTVEVRTDATAIECIGRGPWERFVEVTFGDHIVPVVRLELRLVSELVRNRPERYEPLIAHMRSHGSNLQLVERAMRDRDLNPDLQSDILTRLGSSYHDSAATLRPA
jgi:hypothetical protein